MLFCETMVVYGKNYTEHINTLCGRYVEYFNVKSSGTPDYHCD